MKKIIIFDWDGTLCDSVTHIGFSIQEACRDRGFPIPSDREASSVVGLGIDEALKKLGINLSTQNILRFNKCFQRHYLRGFNCLPLFPGARFLLADLRRKGCQLAIATGKSRYGLNVSLAAHDLELYFIATRCAEESANKPNPAMLFDLLSFTGFQPSEALMIGDTSYDLEMAENAGVEGAAVTYGAHEKERLEVCQPLFLASNILDLQNSLSDFIE